MNYLTTIIGMGMGPADLGARQMEIITSAKVVVGGQRHFDSLPPLTAEKRVIDKNLKELTNFIKNRRKKHPVVVLASGDPLYYGIGSYLTKVLGPQDVNIFPNISGVSAAFSRLKLGWQQARVVSLHGRNQEVALRAALFNAEQIAVYTDYQHNPAWLAGFLLKHRFNNFDLCVLSQMGMPDENIEWYTLAEALELRNVSEPNLIVLKRHPELPNTRLTLFWGMPEDAFVHEKSLITKAEVRAVVLAKLRLYPEAVLWDLGAGCGSVSVEAGSIIQQGQIVAVEQKAERIAHIEENARRFGLANIDVRQLELPEGMEDLPPPDRIFIGGGGQALEAILSKSIESLPAGGVLVVNTVLLENMLCARQTMDRLQMNPETIQIQINRSHSMPWGQRLQAQNPVWITQGIKT